jgi:hypothetical protein
MSSLSVLRIGSATLGTDESARWAASTPLSTQTARLRPRNRGNFMLCWFQQASAANLAEPTSISARPSGA